MYAAIRYDISELVHVYIDSSFTIAKRSQRKTDTTNMGVGFALVDKHERFAGYGTIAMTAPPAGSSEIAELRGILYFFALMKRHFFNEYNADTKFIVHADNYRLAHLLATIATNNGEAFDAKTQSFLSNIGKNRKKIFSLLKACNIEFRWIKGHADNPFNNLAHKLAVSCYRSNQEGRPFVGSTRIHFIKRSISQLHDEMDPSVSTAGKFSSPVIMTNTVGEALQSRNS
jgi:ribonuclease HI